METTTNQNKLLVKMVLDAWQAQIQNTNKLLDLLSDEQLQNEVAPGCNRGIYLVGHLAAVNDKMLPLLNFGAQNYPQLNVPFLDMPDKVATDIPSAAALRTYWINSCVELTKQFNRLSVDSWFERHTSVSPEDFDKEPHRNKLNTIITRTAHLSYHLGQLILLKK